VDVDVREGVAGEVRHWDRGGVWWTKTVNAEDIPITLSTAVLLGLVWISIGVA